jgi:hypothetical protein
MGQINPFAGYYAGSTQVQRLQAAEKDQQVRRNAERTKNAGLEGDELEHQVESSEEIVPLHNDEPHRDSQRPRHPHHDRDDDADDPASAPPHLDVTA